MIRSWGWLAISGTPEAGTTVIAPFTTRFEASQRSPAESGGRVRLVKAPL